MATKTLAQIRARVSQNIGDYISEVVTTALTTNTSVVSTNLSKHTYVEDYFKRWWCLITDYANAGANRRVMASSVLTNNLTVSGAAFASDSANLATFELHRFNPDNYTRAINQAARDLVNYLHRKVEWDDTMVFGNWLPNSHFEDWTSSSYPDKWGVTNATAAETTTINLTHGGASSAKVTASADNGYMYCSGLTNYPRLLALGGETISCYAWVYPEAADDAAIVIYTVKADGTAQTLTSTTPCPAGKWTRLELENQTINEDIVDFQVRLKVATNTKYAYFDNVRLEGAPVFEYLLPLWAGKGTVSEIYQQTSGNAEDIADDVFTAASSCRGIYNWQVYSQEGDSFIRFPMAFSSAYKMILSGNAPLEDNLSSETSTMTIDDPQLQLLAAYACYKLMEMQMSPVSSDDTDKTAQIANYWRGQAEMLKHQVGMPRTQTMIKFGRN